MARRDLDEVAYMKTPENFMEYLAAHRDCSEEILDYARMQTTEDIETGTEPKIVNIRRMISSVRTEIHKMRGFVRLVPVADEISYGFMEPEHDIGKWVAESFAHRFPNTQIILGNNERTWRAQYSCDGIMQIQGPGIIETLDELKKQTSTHLTAKGTETERLWMTYYLSQYCHDRQNLKLFQKQMPEKHMEAAGLTMEKSAAYLPLASFM